MITAVTLAEHTAGSVEAFARRMNEKAEELGCTDTHFVTPNGLDAEDEGGAHTTTAEDLARIMRYCIVESPKKRSFKNYPDQKLLFYGSFWNQKLYLPEPQSVSGHDGRGLERKNRIYGKCRLLLRGSTGKGWKALYRGAPWLRLAQQ